jgi:hypothetical protein
MWNETWENYTLFLGSINSEEDADVSDNKPKMEVISAADLF